MKAVLGLIEDKGVGTLQDLVGDLFSPVGRLTMHHHYVLIRPGYHVLANLISSKGLASRLQFLLLSHTCPDIRVDYIGSLHGLLHPMGNQHPSSVLLRRTQDLRIWLIAFGTGQRKRERELLGGLDPRMGHVVSVADKGDLQSLQFALAL